jgi:hypothetical protein
MALPQDSSCDAEYEDGYIHSETDFNDISPYTHKHNIFNDILEKRPEAEHGRLVRFSAYWKDNRYDVNWLDLPDNARPVRFRHGYHTLHEDGTEESAGRGFNSATSTTTPPARISRKSKRLPRWQ